MIPPDEVPERWARQHLRASQGALIIRYYEDGRQEPMRIPTLVPAHVGGTGDNAFACHWLKNGLCEIHPVAPFGCAFFECRQSREQADRLSSQGLRAISADFEQKGLYSRLWTMLWEEGLRSPDVALKRAALAESFEKRQQRRRRNWLHPRRRY
jgi:hypothetical protein